METGLDLLAISCLFRFTALQDLKGKIMWLSKDSRSSPFFSTVAVHKAIQQEPQISENILTTTIVNACKSLIELIFTETIPGLP